MKCNQMPNEDCNNEDLKKCAECESPMWCLCERTEVVKITNDLWKQANEAHKERGN